MAEAKADSKLAQRMALGPSGIARQIGFAPVRTAAVYEDMDLRRQLAAQAIEIDHLTAEVARLKRELASRVVATLRERDETRDETMRVPSREEMVSSRGDETWDEIKTGRPRQYGSDAERKRAYRERKKARA